jgi:hypothetical protein
MELAQALQLLWGRKIWLALGLVVALVVGVATLSALKTEQYATAATQMIVDSPKSPLGNTSASLNPFTARASVFADLMASHPALVAIGQAAHIPADQIVATGPANPAGATTVSPVPPGPAQPVTKYKLFLDQDPTLPTVNIYAVAPTTAQAIALANGAVTGFSAYLTSVEDQNTINADQRVEIRQLGQAVGGMVDPHASKKIAAVVVLLVLLMWCGGILLIERKRAARVPRERKAAVAGTVPGLENDALYSAPAHEWASEPRLDLEMDRVGNGGRRDDRVSNGGRHDDRVSNGGRHDDRVKPNLTADLDATLAELATPQAQSGTDALWLPHRAEVPLVEPASAPDER